MPRMRTTPSKKRISRKTTMALDAYDDLGEVLESAIDADLSVDACDAWAEETDARFDASSQDGRAVEANGRERNRPRDMAPRGSLAGTSVGLPPVRPGPWYVSRASAPLRPAFRQVGATRFAVTVRAGDGPGEFCKADVAERHAADRSKRIVVVFWQRAQPLVGSDVPLEYPSSSPARHARQGFLIGGPTVTLRASP
jgi:hypothetical protein